MRRRLRFVCIQPCERVDRQAHQLPFPPPSFLVFFGSTSTWPCFPKNLGSIGSTGCWFSSPWTRSPNLWERVTLIDISNGIEVKGVIDLMILSNIEFIGVEVPKIDPSSHISELEAHGGIAGLGKSSG